MVKEAESVDQMSTSALSPISVYSEVLDELMQGDLVFDDDEVTCRPTGSQGRWPAPPSSWCSSSDSESSDVFPFDEGLDEEITAECGIFYNFEDLQRDDSDEDADDVTEVEELTCSEETLHPRAPQSEPVDHTTKEETPADRKKPLLKRCFSAWKRRKVQPAQVDPFQEARTENPVLIKGDLGADLVSTQLELVDYNEDETVEKPAGHQTVGDPHPTASAAEKEKAKTINRFSCFLCDVFTRTMRRLSGNSVRPF